jgi:hypothetical protein
MNESLLDMVKQGAGKSVSRSKHIEELVPEQKVIEVEAKKLMAGKVFELPLVSLSEWFLENTQKVDSVRVAKVNMAGVNPKKTIIVAVPEARGEKDSSSDSDTKEVMVIKKCLQKQVINLPPCQVDIFDHDVMRIIYPCSDDVFVKSYCLKTGLTNVFCLKVDECLVPYTRDRTKRGSKTIAVPVADVGYIKERLAKPADVQKIHLLYKQVEKQMNSMKTNMEAVVWLNARQEGVIDVNHLMQLDDTIIYIMSET